MDDTVAVARIHHDHGVEVYVGDDREAALHQVSLYADRYFEKEHPDAEKPNELSEIREKYFELCSERSMTSYDYYEITMKDVETETE